MEKGVNIFMLNPFKNKWIYTIIMDFVDIKEPTNTSTSTSTSTINNIVSTDNTIVDETLEGSEANVSTEETPQQVNLLDIPVTDENTALNVMVAFINLAQRRGVFNVQESAKVWECIQQFKKSSEKTN